VEIVAFDTETECIVSGLLAPPMVCGSIAAPTDAWLTRINTLDYLRDLLGSDEVIAGANLPYDVGVTVESGGGESLLQAWLDAYDADRIHDVQVAEMLHAIAEGHLGVDPRTGGELKSPSTGKKAWYSLECVTDLVLGRQDAKARDFWRLRYAMLANIPIERWPADAREYPLDDVRNTREVALAQIARNRNLQRLPEECRAALALHLSACWGLRSDPQSVDTLRARVDKARHEGYGRFAALKWFKGADGPATGSADEDKINWSAIKRVLARAHGAAAPCPRCNGSGKALSAKTGKEVLCTSKNLGITSEDTAPGNGCDGTGLDLREARMLGRTPAGGVGRGRDALLESGDENLIDFAEYAEDDKIHTLYLKILDGAVTHPLNTRPNVLVGSGRTSYRDGIHGLPREGGVRECFIPSPGRVLCSTDYSAIELCTLAQTCLWLVGHSRMATMINESKDPGSLHTNFGARLAGKSIDKKSPFRQAAKAGNFGFPGGMGVPKFVYKKREKKEGVTFTPDGRRYWGLRFCILIGGAERCGAEMTMRWRDRYDHPPVCTACCGQVERMREEWFALFPEVPEYLKIVSQLTDMGSEIIVPPAAVALPAMTRGGVSYTDGANGFFQGLAALGAKRALWLITRECYDRRRQSPLYGTRVSLFLHDEVLSDMPEETAHLAGPRQAELMIEGMRVCVPDVHVACEPALMRRWTKAVEPVFVDGKLVPWEPKEKT